MIQEVHADDMRQQQNILQEKVYGKNVKDRLADDMRQQLFQRRCLCSVSEPKFERNMLMI